MPYDVIAIFEAGRLRLKMKRKSTPSMVASTLSNSSYKGLRNAKYWRIRRRLKAVGCMSILGVS
jgi:hypothetical protein